MRFIAIKRTFFGKLATTSLKLSRVVDRVAKMCVYNWYYMVKKDPAVSKEVLEAIQHDSQISKIIEEFEHGQS